MSNEVTIVCKYTFLSLYLLLQLECSLRYPLLYWLCSEHRTISAGHFCDYTLSCCKEFELLCHSLRYCFTTVFEKNGKEKVQLDISSASLCRFLFPRFFFFSFSFFFFFLICFSLIFLLLFLFFLAPCFLFTLLLFRPNAGHARGCTSLRNRAPFSPFSISSSYIRVQSSLDRHAIWIELTEHHISYTAIHQTQLLYIAFHPAVQT